MSECEFLSDKRQQWRIGEVKQQRATGEDHKGTTFHKNLPA